MKRETSSKTAYGLKRKHICQDLNLGSIMYYPRTCLRTYYKVGDTWHFAASNPDGLILGSSPIKDPPKGGAGSRFKHLYAPGLHRFHDRRRLLSFVVHVIMECGLNKKAYKTLKRLNLVAFTCRFNDLRKMVRRFAGDCNYRHDLLATRPRITARGIPSLTGETKSVESLNGICIPLWLRKMEEIPPYDPW